MKKKQTNLLGETFGDMTCINNAEKIDLINESKSNEQTSSLFDEVMQAFTDIYSETDLTSFPSDEITSK